MAPAQEGGRLSMFADRQFKYLAVTPAVAIILLIGLFPIVYSAVVSFQNINMLEEDTSFIGLLNYQRLLEDTRFWLALGHTFLFLAIALPVELILGLLLAYLFLDRMPGRQVFVALLVLPVVISPIVSGAMWSILLDQRFGPINQILGWIAGREVTLLWTVNPALVYPAILAAEIWQWTPFMFLLLLAALSNVDKSQLEAAEIDGAGFWKKTRHIIFPGLKPLIIINFAGAVTAAFQSSQNVLIMTGGGPNGTTEVAALRIFYEAFMFLNFGPATAMAWLLGTMLIGFTVIQLKRLSQMEFKSGGR